MNQIVADKVHFVTSQNLTDIQNEEWEIIATQKHSFILSDNCDIKFLRFPGFVFSSEEAQRCYLKIYKDFIDNNIYTPSRGNLSKNNNYIFIGIRPGHVYAHLSKADTAWLFGPSSVLLHRFLIDMNIYPYFTNIYNEPNKPFNKDFKFICKELIVVLYIYKVVYDISEMNIVFMGSYDEYPLLKTYISQHPVFRKLNMSINYFSIWHPGFLARSFSQSRFEDWKKQITLKQKITL